MAIFVFDTGSGKNVAAEIIEIRKNNLPGKDEGWYFDWKNTNLTDCKVFQLRLKGDSVVQGLVAFHIKEEMAIMRLLEVAPHNWGKNSRFDRVAGSLIAKCCRLSYTEPKSPIWRGYLTFIPVNETVGRLYQSKYHAVGDPKGLMSIGRENSRKLIEEYL